MDKEFVHDEKVIFLGVTPRKPKEPEEDSYRQLIWVPKKAKWAYKIPVITDTFYMHIEGQGPVIVTPQDGDIIIDPGSETSLRQYWKIYQYWKRRGFVQLETQAVQKTEY